MTTVTSKSILPITLGCMTFGEEGTEGARVFTVKGVEELLDIFQNKGHNELDTARSYTAGTSEEMLGKIDWKARGLVMDTKLYPHNATETSEAITHSKGDLRKQLDIQLKALNCTSIDMWYLHVSCMICTLSFFFR